MSGHNIIRQRPDSVIMRSNDTVVSGLFPTGQLKTKSTTFTSAAPGTPAGQCYDFGNLCIVKIDPSTTNATNLAATVDCGTLPSGFRPPVTIGAHTFSGTAGGTACVLTATSAGVLTLTPLTGTFSAQPVLPFGATLIFNKTFIA